MVNGRRPPVTGRPAARPHLLPHIDCIGFGWIFAYMEASNPFA
ncbi:hypothetical protein BRAO375_1840004 [Bradyrhizobium sp. ORS 375]|nr:hypothetical protein BRAO375_1840004 [Bradyrhizobium sp. ORS 375]